MKILPGASVSHVLLPAALFCLGPMAALAPRLLWLPPVLAALVFLPALFQERGRLKIFFTCPPVLLALAALFYSGLSLLWSPTPKPFDSASGLLGCGVCALVFAAYLKRNPVRLSNTSRLFLALGLLAGFFLLAGEFLLDYPLHRRTNGLDAAALINDNVLKRAIAALALLLWPVAALLEQKRGRLWSLGVLAVFAGFTFIATNRSAALGMAAGLAALGLAFFSAKGAQRLLTGVIVAGLALTVPLFNLVPLWEAELAPYLFDTAEWRVKIWMIAAPRVGESLAFGHGIDSLRGMLFNLGGEGLPYIKPGIGALALHPHHVFLQLWLDFGAAGALLWGALMLWGTRALLQLPLTTRPYALAAAFCSLAMLCATFSPLQGWWAGAHVMTALLFMFQAPRAGQE